MFILEVPDVGEKYESRKRSAAVTEAVGSTHDLVSRGDNAMLIDKSHRATKMSTMRLESI